MRNADSNRIAEAGELARCIAETHGEVSEAQLKELFEVLFGAAADAAEWELFRTAYVAALCEPAKPQPSATVVLETRPQAQALTAVGVMTLAWTAAPRLELLDLFCQVL
jgi:hypothetical protein